MFAHIFRSAAIPVADAGFDAFFTRAAHYPVVPPTAVREDSPRPPREPFRERHLQAVWFDPILRPARLFTAQGEEVAVEDPGVWNLEAGPDFLGAVLRIGPAHRRIAGDVEVHVRPGDWHAHGHAADPRYGRVRIHVTYHPGPAAGPAADGLVHVPLRDALTARPEFSFEAVDLTAYPYGARATPPPCAAMLRGWSPDRKGALLDAAGEERLRRKTERLARLIAERGAEQALYEETLAALGYKHNKVPCRRLAERLPVQALRAEAQGNDETAYALLLGVAGLLPEKIPVRWDDPARALVRRLWDAWWKRRERWIARVMPAGAWQLGGTRPLNLPPRRLMAAARLFTAQNDLAGAWTRFAREQPAGCVRLAGEGLEAGGETFWERRLAWGGKPLATPAALIGAARAAAMLTNIYVPFAATLRLPGLTAETLCAQLPAEDPNRLVRQTAFGLFGPDHSPRLYAVSLRRQGLLQIFEDFCLDDRSRCANCPLPEALRQAG